jgi:hypothetical protein
MAASYTLRGGNPLSAGSDGRTMSSVHYGHEGFVSNSHFVRAKHGDERLGQFVDGFAEPERAVSVARALSEDGAYQDVIVISLGTKEALVRVFKGVQWFAEGDLNRQFPGAWRLASGEPDAIQSVPESSVLVPLAAA